MKYGHGPLWKRLEILICLLVLSFLVSVQGEAWQAPTANTSAQHQHEVHSHLFRGQTIETIPELLSKTSGNLRIEYDQPPGFTSAPFNTPAYPPYVLVAFACTSDTVIVATAQSGVSHITSDQRFVYTDWGFSVEQILKPNPELAITPGSALVITRAGGTLEVNGRKVVAADAGFKDFKVGGRYLLFLESIPQTGAYKATAEKSFSLITNNVGSLAKDNPLGFEAKNAEVLLQDTKAAIDPDGRMNMVTNLDIGPE